MPIIKVKLFANFREFTKTKEIQLEGNTLRDVLNALSMKFPGIERIIFKGEGEGEVLKPYINIYLNGNSILESGGMGIRLNENDEIAIFPPVSGG